MFLGAVAGLISYVVCGRLDVLRIVAFGAAASKVPLKSQLRSALAVTGIGCLIVMLLSFFGIGYPIKATELYRGGGIYETRYSWGLGHPNAFHCMFLMLLLLAVAVYFEKMTWYHLLIACILNVVIYRYTDSNFGFCSVMLALVLAVFLKYPCFSFLKKCLIRLRMFWVVVCIGISVYFAYSGAENDTWRRVLDDLVLNGRIQLAYINASPHSWLPFGSSSATEFFDMGWVRVFYWYGWIPALLGCIILLVTAYSLKAEKDKGILLLFLVLVLYTVFEAHIISPYLGRNALIFVCGFYSMRKLKGKEPVFFYRLCKPFS